MQELDVLSQNQVVRLIAQVDKREFTLFLGAGASKSSGVPLASEMISEWRRMAYEDRAPAGADFDAWCKEQPWCGKDEEYSRLFEMLFPNERARQKYIEPKVEAAFPSWCYLYLASIVQAGYFNVIFTTNFDDLMNDALTMYLGYNPVVCAADSEVMSISVTTDRAKIIKLHGDYLFKRLKNTVEELEELDPNMESKFREFGKQCGMVVIGYAGRDQSTMHVLEEIMKDESAFPNGIFWGVRPNDQPSERVKKLATTFRKRFHLFHCQDFDLFMSHLHTTLKLNLPQTVLQPYDALRGNIGRLVEKATDNQLGEPSIREHIQKLKQELNRSWAKADLTDFDLLEAQVALGRRDYKTAISYVTRYCQERPNDPSALTTWGDALAIQGEEEDSEAAFQEAAARWTEAIRLNPQALPPRYSLARYYARAQKTAEGVAACEGLLKLVPNDHAVRRNLIMLYSSSSRYGDALREVDKLLARDPEAADLHALKANVLEQRGLIMESLDEIKRAVALDPKNAMYHFSLANSLTRLGRLDEAAFEFNQAIQLDPNTLSYRLQIANFYSMRQQPMLALQHMEAAVAIEPNSAEAHGWLGQIYLNLGRLMEAQREMEAALRLSPQDSRTLGNVGILYLRLNRLRDAEGCLQRSVQLNPSLPQPFYMLCLLYWVQNRVPEFNAAFQSLLQILPPVAQQLQMQLQDLHMRFMGNRQAALHALQTQSLGWLQNQPQVGESKPWLPPSPNNSFNPRPR
ncbi:MAG TPA: tetratricopeptide repeat protein [Pyrinomonadaceae bacterium]|jgi:tetratricopeptide (TPR) repeat protein|nr:tetratricopeptide repeat protein [Pyrinomonadaceae bacterium]